MEPGQPGAFAERFDEALPVALVGQSDAELGGRGGGAHRSDRAAADLRIDPDADPGAGRPGAHQGVGAFQLLPVVDVDGDTVFQGRGQLAPGLGGRVEDDPVRFEARRQRLGELAGAGHLAAHAELAQPGEQRDQAVRLGGEGVQDVEAVREGRPQVRDARGHAVEVDEGGEQRVLGVEQPSADGFAQHAFTAGGGVRAGRVGRVGQVGRAGGGVRNRHGPLLRWLVGRPEAQSAPGVAVR